MSHIHIPFFEKGNARTTLSTLFFRFFCPQAASLIARRSAPANTAVQEAGVWVLARACPRTVAAGVRRRTDSRVPAENPPAYVGGDPLPGLLGQPFNHLHYLS